MLFQFPHTNLWSTSETSRPHDHQACQAPIPLKRLNLTTADPIFSLRLIDQESRHSRVACHPLECSLYQNSRGICRDSIYRHVDSSSTLAPDAAGRVGLGWLKAISP